MHVRLLLRWLRVLRNDTDAQHVVARRVYVRSVAWPLYFKSTEMRPGLYDLMLVPQTDYLKGLDCRVHTLHLLRTARLNDDWRSLIQRLSPSSASSTQMPHLMDRSRVPVGFGAELEEQEGAGHMMLRADAVRLSSEEAAFVTRDLYPWDSQLSEVATHIQSLHVA